ncbi:hypothetical protein NMY22_g7575 [Coprinellus aureogranulatus]|nr:hypothetical protein NMY22_g7575 [Coprinellus aureogranulatus]
MPRTPKSPKKPARSAPASPSKRYRCSVGCGKSFSSESDLTRHKETHQPASEKPHRCPFEDCTYSSWQKTSLRTHLNTAQHNNKKPHKCPDYEICKFETADPSSLTRHRKRKHGYIPKLKRKPQAERDELEGNGGESKENNPVIPVASQGGSTSEQTQTAPAKPKAKAKAKPRAKATVRKARKGESSSIARSTLGTIFPTRSHRRWRL